MFAEQFAVCAVHLGKIVNIFQKYMDVQNVVQIQAYAVEHGLEIKQNLFGLAVSAAAGHFSGIRVNARCAGYLDEIAGFAEMAVWADWGEQVVGGVVFDIHMVCLYGLEGCVSVCGSVEKVCCGTGFQTGL